MKGRWVGPFPIVEFLGILPGQGPKDPPRPPSDIFDHILVGESKEKDMYPSLITALKSLGLEKLQFKDTSNNPDHKSPTYKERRPGISVYSSDIEFESEDPKDLTYADKAEEPSPMRFSDLVLPFVLTRGKFDPFTDKRSRPDSRFESVYTEAQGRLAAILNEMLSFTWRTHAFSVFMDNHIARLFRADRAGVLVSEAFDYRKNPVYLTNFLHFLNNMKPDQWGFDSTVNRDDNTIYVPSVHCSEEKYDGVKLDDGEELPHTESLVGSGRRVVRVRYLKSKLNEPHIMKDGWRPDIQGITPEWSILSELSENGVPHIPTFLSGGDIGGQQYHSTLANAFADEFWRVGPRTKLTPRRHYRYLENGAGRPLEEFRDAQELTLVLRDVIEALRDAWVKCGYLHRDVSSGNILIARNGKGSEGVVIDWEYAKKYPEGEEPQRRVSGRTGTWAYMSAALLMNKNKPHSPLDDLQSVYWVGLMHSLNKLEHNNGVALAGVAECLVEYTPLLGGGGYRKAGFLVTPPAIKFVDNPAFTSLMDDFHQMMRITHQWQFEPTKDQVTARTQLPPNIPDYQKVLDRFNEALTRPSHEWSPRLCTDQNQLRPLMKKALGTPTGSQSKPSGSQKTSQPSEPRRRSQRSESRRTSQSSGSNLIIPSFPKPPMQFDSQKLPEPSISEESLQSNELPAGSTEASTTQSGKQAKIDTPPTT